MPASRPQLIALLTGVTGVYYLAGSIGLAFFGLLHPSASAVWPPTGVAIAALLVYGPRIAPAVFAGAFLVNYTTAGSIVASVGIAAGNTLEGLTAAYLVTRFANGPGCFARAVDICMFAVLGAVASTMLSATVGVGVLTLLGMADPRQFGAIWLTWWLGDAAGAMLVTPLLLTWYREPWLRATPARAVEALLMFATVVAATALLFFDPRLGRYPLPYLCAPPLLWAAFRFGQRDVATAVVAMSVVATWATAAGRGPFVLGTPNESLLVLQSFTATSALTALIVGALVREGEGLLKREQTALADSEAALRSRDVFIAMLSHELRNPLSAIAAASELIQRGATSADVAARAAAIIKRQTAHFTRLIDDLLDVARGTAGKMALSRQRIDLAEAVRGALQSSLRSNDRESPRLEQRLDSVWVDADPGRLNQIVTNLLHNAMKYTPNEGSIRISTLADGGDAVLRIEDSGSGIAPELLPRVFDLFTQGPQGPDRPYGGLGIGLTLVRWLVELHSGRVEAHSEGLGRGSTFVVRLPLAAALAAGGFAAAKGGTRPGGNRILVVEDNVDARESLRMLLEQVGHEVFEAADGQTGIRRALELEPSVVLVDIGLPDLDGCDVARHIRSLNPRIALIALSGYGRDEDKARSLDAGFDAHLVKPVVLQTLLIAMEGLLARNAH
jgi:signal transduction histidine kinase